MVDEMAKILVNERPDTGLTIVNATLILHASQRFKADDIAAHVDDAITKAELFNNMFVKRVDRVSHCR